MKRKNAAKNPKLQKAPKATMAPPPEPPIDKRWFIAGGVGLLVIVALTFALIRFYADPLDAVVARVNGHNISARQVYANMGPARNNALMGYGGTGDEVNWGSQFRGTQTLEEAVLEDAARAAARDVLIAEYAKELDLPLSGHENFNQIAEMIAWYVLDDPDLMAEFEPYIPEDGSPDPQDILDRALSGEDFMALRQAYCQDHGQPPEGYTFVTGTMVESFYEATKYLEIGEISGLVPSNFGYHIIKRTEPTPENVMLAPGQTELEEGQELLGAMHILVNPAPPEHLIMQAVAAAFEARVEDADFVTRRGLSNLSAQ